MLINIIKAIIRSIREEWNLAIKNILLPSYCIRCDERILTEDNIYYCPRCWSTLTYTERPYCSICGIQHPIAIGFGTRSNFPCADCRKNPNKYIESIQSPLQYKELAREAIILFKYHREKGLIKPFGEILRNWAKEEMSNMKFDLIIPVPLHPLRLKRRGFNQSFLLAQEIVTCFPEAEISQALIRTKPTHSQSTLSTQERKENIKNAFEIKEPEKIKQKRILLIDDLVTSGATVTECAKTLKKHGALTVNVLSLARAHPKEFPY
ncbi:MAG: ComF family protein [Candidatus Hydrogenedentes bacterium]|nr:ComF family protein [Candidatus Hydrogenedentota bacterium]